MTIDLVDNECEQVVKPCPSSISISRSPTITLEQFNNFVKQTEEREKANQRYIEMIEQKIEKFSSSKEKKSFVRVSIFLFAKENSQVFFNRSTMEST